MRRVEEWRYFEVLPILETAVRRKSPPFSFAAETRRDLERIVGSKPELISSLEHAVAPAGHLIRPSLDYSRKRTSLKAAQWRRVSHALARLQASLASLDYDAGEDLQTGDDGFWEFEHGREGPDIDLIEFHEHAARISQVLEWLLRRDEEKPKRRGRRGGISTDRHFLGLGVATVLQRAGFKLTKGRDGVLARCLEVLFDLTGHGVPKDMFDCVRSIVRTIETYPQRRKEAQARRAARDKPPVE